MPLNQIKQYSCHDYEKLPMEPLSVPLEVMVPNTGGDVFQKNRQRFADV